MNSVQDKLFIGYVYCVFFIYLVRAFVPSGILNFADDIVFLLLILNLFSLGKGRKINFDFAIVLLCIFVFLYFIYGLINDNQYLAPLMYFRHYKNLFLVFIVATIDKSCFERTMKLVYLALAVSVPISFYQFKTADMSNTSWWDEVGGVLGRDGNSGTLSLLILIFVAYEYFRRIRDNRSVLGLYLFFMLPMLINETKIVIFMIPIVFFIVSLVVGMGSFKRLIVILPVFFVGGILINYAYIVFFGYSVLNTIDLDFIEGYFFVDEAFSAQEIDIGRFMRLIYADEYLSNQGMFVKLFGEGLGASFYGQNSGVEGKIVSEFFVLRLHTGSRNQMYQMLLEFGYIGSFIFIILILTSWLSVIFSSKRGDEEILAIVTVPVFLLALFYQPVIESKVVAFLMFYSLAASKLNKVRSR